MSPVRSSLSWNGSAIRGLFISNRRPVLACHQLSHQTAIQSTSSALASLSAYLVAWCLCHTSWEASQSRRTCVGDGWRQLDVASFLPQRNDVFRLPVPRSSLACCTTSRGSRSVAADVRGRVINERVFYASELYLLSYTVTRTYTHTHTHTG